MRIVFANKYFYPNGGADQYMLRLKALMESAGHEIAPFAMASEKNLETPWKKYFVSEVQTEKVSLGWEALRTALRTIYSLEARRKFGRLLDEFKPDVVHIFNIYYQISPSIIAEAKKRGIPVVQTALDYNLIAPNYVLYHGGKICEVTKPDRFFRAVSHRCVKDSALASAVAAKAMWVQKKLGVDWRSLDAIIAPSDFVARKMGEYGVDEKKMVRVPYFIETASVAPAYGGEYALYVGRLSPEKGPEVLVRAAALAPEVPLKIVGRGPEEKAVHALARKLGVKNVEFLGFVDDLAAVYAGARFVVIPSTCYDVAPLVTLEAYAAGKAVLGADIGGLGEQVIEGATGYRFRPSDAKDLAERMQLLWNSPEDCVRMGKRARQEAEEQYDPEVHAQRIEEVYRNVLRK